MLVARHSPAAPFSSSRQGPVRNARCANPPRERRTLARVRTYFRFSVTLRSSSHRVHTSALAGKRFTGGGKHRGDPSYSRQRDEGAAPIGVAVEDAGVRRDIRRVATDTVAPTTCSMRVASKGEDGRSVAWSARGSKWPPRGGRTHENARPSSSRCARYASPLTVRGALPPLSASHASSSLLLLRSFLRAEPFFRVTRRAGARTCRPRPSNSHRHLLFFALHPFSPPPFPLFLSVGRFVAAGLFLLFCRLFVVGVFFDGCLRAALFQTRKTKARGRLIDGDF